MIRKRKKKKNKKNKRNGSPRVVNSVGTGGRPKVRKVVSPLARLQHTALSTPTFKLHHASALDGLMTTLLQPIEEEAHDPEEI